MARLRVEWPAIFVTNAAHKKALQLTARQHVSQAISFSPARMLIARRS
jgi:hypothetical protein